MLQVIKCQYCLDRQIEEPNDAIGLYKKQPICDECLGPIMDNNSNTQIIEYTRDPGSLEARKAKAFEILDKFEELLEGWELYEDEVLLSRDDFFNHRPPAVVNLTPEEIKKRISYRKAVLFSFRIKDEHWTTLIEQIRTKERREQGLINVQKSVKEVTKKSRAGKDQLQKLAKKLGVSVEQLELLGAQARQEEFKGVVGKKVIEEVKKESEVSEVLKDIQKQINTQTTGNYSTPVVKRCERCKKLTCICPRS